MEKVISYKKLKTKHLIFVLFLILPFWGQGQKISKCPAYPDTIQVLQGKDYYLKCLIKGDEFYSMTITIDGYPLVENKNGILEYAITDNKGNISTSGIIAKNITDRTSNEKNWLKTKGIRYDEVFKLHSVSLNDVNAKSNNLDFSVKSFPTSGTRNLLVLLIDFTDQTFQITSGNFNNLMNQSNYNGTGSFRDFWRETSYNSLTINSTINGWYHATHNMAYYGANTNGSDSNPKLLVREAIDAAENAGVNFSTFDNDHDGYVDDIIVVHSGYGEEAGGGANTIWSHHSKLGSYSRTYDGVTIDGYVLVPELRGNFGSYISNIGVFCHEFGHSLGLPDLYDTDNSSEGIGRWGLMGSGVWNNNGSSPSILSAWSKIFLGYSSATVISSPGSFSLSNSDQNNTFYRVNTPHSNEYFLLENRQLVGFDVGLPGDGLAIWHINTSKTTSSHINANDVNADENLKGVDLEEADGLNNLDNHNNRGDSGDLFPGNSCNFSFNDYTNPNSQTYAPITNTNKPISNIAKSGNNIRFDFNGYNPIVGPSDVCISGTSFSISNFPTGATLTWSNSSNITRNSSQGSNPCNFSANSTGSGWIKATISVAGCTSNIVIQKNLVVGSYLPLDLRLRDPSTNNPVYVICNLQSTTVKATHDGGFVPDSWQWSVSGASVSYPYGSNGNLATLHPYSYNITVKVKAHNSCGWSDWADVTPDVMPCGSMYFMVSPNPANTEINISSPIFNQNESNTLNDSNTPVYSSVQIEIFEINGNKITQINFGKNDNMKINVSDFKKGVYFLKIIAGELEETHEIIIN